MAALPLGTRVVVQGLVQRPELNGVAGTVVTADTGSGRCGVELQLAEGLQRLSVKRQNLSEADTAANPVASGASGNAGGANGESVADGRFEGELSAANGNGTACTSTAITAAAAVSAVSGSVEEAAERVAELVEQLRGHKAGTEGRRSCVLALQAELLQVDGAPPAEFKRCRPVLNAFLDAEGPQVLHEIESSMTGDWVTDAKNGTLKAISQIAKLPGPVGTALANFRELWQRRVEAAAKAQHDANCPVDHVSPGGMMFAPGGRAIDVVRGHDNH